MTRPTKYPRWATVPTADPTYGGINKVEPTEGRKDTGWLVEYPTANIQNWFMNLTYQWLEYLDTLRQSLPFAVATETEENQYAFDIQGYFSVYDDAMFFRARFPTVNTGAVQCDVDGIGLKDLVDNGEGDALAGGELNTDKEYLIAYSESGAELRLLDRITATDSMMDAGNLRTVDVTPRGLSRIMQNWHYLKGNATSGDGQNFVVSLTPALAAYSDGQVFSIRFDDAQTVASPTLNINGLGVKDIKMLGQHILEADILVNNQHYLLAYSSQYNDFHILTPTRALKAQMRAATSREVFATPAEMQNSPVCAKAWVNFNGTGTLAIRDSYGVSSVTDKGVGFYRTNFNFTWANDDYSVSGMSDGDVSGAWNQIGNNAFSTTWHDFDVFSGTNKEDATYVTLSYFGENTG